MSKYSLKKTFLFFLLGLFFIFPVSIMAATLSVSPINAVYSVGDRVSMKVVVASDKPINAISGTLLFPKSIFSIESISKTSSVLNFWVAEPTFSNSTGSVQFEGVSLSGFTGDSGNVITVNLKAIQEGEGVVSFKSGQVLANDGQGTDVTGNLRNATFKVVVPKTAPKELPVEKEPEPVLATPEKQNLLTAPIIELGKKDGIVVVQGYSDYERTGVLLTFLSKSNSKVFISGSTEGNGEFSIIIPNALRDGSYSVNATIVFDNGRYSPPSNSIDLKVGSFFGLNFFLGILVLLLLVILLLFIKKRLLYKKDSILLQREVSEAKEVVHKSFENLKEDLEDYEGVSKSVSRRASQTDTVMKKIKDDLKKAEEKIEKEIKDLEQ